MYPNVMLDLETLGNGVNPVILSIGAVKFDEDEIHDTFHVGVDIQSCLDRGLKVDGSTVMWWFDPDRDEARQAWLNLNKVELYYALDGLSQWYGEVSVPIWGNGATFDNIALRSAYKACGLEYPARFWDDQCYRTVKYLRPDTKLVREGTHHDALADAISQAKHLQALWKELKA